MADGQSLLQMTLRRLRSLGKTAPPVLICNTEHERAMHEHASAVGYADLAMILEPEGRNTAAAICAAALWTQRRGSANEPILVIPADHVIADEARFAVAVEVAIELARRGKVVTFGMKPDRPATGYGYIELGAAIDASRAQYDVRRFIEKPDVAKAAEFVASGRHYWNSGMFVATAATLVSEFRRYRPDILAGVEKAFPSGQLGNRANLDRVAFTEVDAIAFDRAIMERTASAATVLAEIGWNDIGDWQNMWEFGEKNDRGNAISGPSSAVDTTNSLIRSEGPELLCIGLEDVVAVANGDAILVARRSYAQKIGELVEQTRAGTSPARKPPSNYREYELPEGTVRMLGELQRGLRVFVCVKGRGRIATAAHEHTLEPGSAITLGAAETCRIEANVDSFLKVIEILID
jgi:mannose-1-phosphate guanylyltransferase/mannose-1-phosphate guanylyltransferase/mannose-6-phosphate isomerase